MTEPVPDLVTLQVWRVPTHRVGTALARLALDRPSVRAVPGLRFAKLLGTGSGRTFSPWDADLRRYALLATWRSAADAARFRGSPLIRRWERISAECWRVDLRPLSARGRWSRRTPFGDPVPTSIGPGPTAAITRARLVKRRIATFWLAVPPVAADLHGAAGLRLAMAVGEAPVGLQGTFSLWDSAAALRDFAYQRPAHRQVVRRTAEEHWYAEELFTRFAVVGGEGTINGCDPLR